MPYPRDPSLQQPSCLHAKGANPGQGCERGHSSFTLRNPGCLSAKVSRPRGVLCREKGSGEANPTWGQDYFVGQGEGATSWNPPAGCLKPVLWNRAKDAIPGPLHEAFTPKLQPSYLGICSTLSSTTLPCADQTALRLSSTRKGT